MKCVVVAPSLTRKEPGRRVEKDTWDSETPAGMRSWCTKYRVWLKNLGPADDIRQMKYRLNIEEIEARLRRIEDEIHGQAESSVGAPVVKSLQAMHGVKEVTAVILVAEVRCFSRFAKAAQPCPTLVYSKSEWSNGAPSAGQTALRSRATSI